MSKAQAEELAKLVTEATDEQLRILRDHGKPDAARAAQREIVKRLGRQLHDERNR